MSDTNTTKTTAVETKRAMTVAVGDRVVERDGAFFTVTEIIDAGRSLIFKLSASGTYMIKPDEARVSKNANVRVLR